MADVPPPTVQDKILDPAPQYPNGPTAPTQEMISLSTTTTPTPAAPPEQATKDTTATDAPPPYQTAYSIPPQATAPPLNHAQSHSVINMPQDADLPTGWVRCFDTQNATRWSWCG